MPTAGSEGTVVAQTAAVATGAILWGVTRRGKLSLRALEIVDAVATAATSAIFIAVGWPLPVWARPELVELLAVSDILMLRAFLVPSTARKTAIPRSTLRKRVRARTRPGRVHRLCALDSAAGGGVVAKARARDQGAAQPPCPRCFRQRARPANRRRRLAAQSRLTLNGSSERAGRCLAPRRDHRRSALRATRPPACAPLRPTRAVAPEK